MLLLCSTGLLLLLVRACLALAAAGTGARAAAVRARSLRSSVLCLSGSALALRPCGLSRGCGLSSCIGWHLRARRCSRRSRSAAAAAAFSRFTRALRWAEVSGGRAPGFVFFAAGVALGVGVPALDFWRLLVESLTDLVRFLMTILYVHWATMSVH